MKLPIDLNSLIEILRKKTPKKIENYGDIQYIF